MKMYQISSAALAACLLVSPVALAQDADVDAEAEITADMDAAEDTVSEMADEAGESVEAAADKVMDEAAEAEAAISDEMAETEAEVTSEMNEMEADAEMKADMESVSDMKADTDMNMKHGERAMSEDHKAETTVTDAMPLSTPNEVKVIVKDENGNIVREYMRPAGDSDYTYTATSTTTTTSGVTTTGSSTTPTTSTTPADTEPAASISATATTSLPAYLSAGTEIQTEGGDSLGVISMVDSASGTVWVQSFSTNEPGKLYQMPASALSLNGSTVMSSMTAEDLEATAS